MMLMLLKKYLFASILLIIMLIVTNIAKAASVDQIAKTGPNFESALEELLKGNEEKAKEELEKEIANNPQSPLGYTWLGDYYNNWWTDGHIFHTTYSEDALEKARELYKRALFVDPECKEAYFGFSATWDVLSFSRLDKETQPIVSKASRILPDAFLEEIPSWVIRKNTMTTQIHYYLPVESEKEYALEEEIGDYFFSNSFFEEAVKYYEIILFSIGPHHATTVNLANCYRVMGDIELQPFDKKKYYRASKYYLTILQIVMKNSAYSINMDEVKSPEQKIQEIKMKLLLPKNDQKRLLEQVKCHEIVGDKLLEAKKRLLAEAIVNYEKALTLVEQNSLGPDLAISFCNKIKNVCTMITSWYEKNGDIFTGGLPEDFPQQEIEKYTKKQKMYEEKLSRLKLK